jgi:ribonuclease BN (tRNA processing enzyme)
MDLTIVGCSGSFPGPDSAASCYLFQAEGFRLLVDLGNGALGALQRYADPGGIDAVCLSHLHTDHCIDMCSYNVFRIHNPSGLLPKIPVYGPAATAERLDRAAVDASRPISDAFDFVTLAPGKIEIGPFAVRTARMSHPVETFGFRLEHGGRSIAYSADTGPTDELIKLARDADILLCEASFTDGPGLPADLHLTGRQAAEHATRAGAGRLVLTHLVPWNSRDQAQAEAAGGFAGDISLAAPGLVL